MEDIFAKIISILPNLSVATIAILALTWLSYKFQDKADAIHLTYMGHLKLRDDANAAELKERESSMRALEKEVRDNILNQLSSNSHLMQRIIDHLNNDKH